MIRRSLIFSLTVVCIIACFIGCMLTGSVDIPPSEVWAALSGNEVARQSWRFIVVETRLPAVCTALLAGAALSVAGLLLQTMFGNPLAGPSILGISSGASLGVAVVILAFGGVMTLWGQISVFLAALVGASLVIVLLLMLSSLLKSPTMLLIAGILIGYLAMSAISLLNFFAPGESVHSYVVWGLGTFNSVTLAMLPSFAALNLLMIAASFLFSKPLNALLLGQRYAESSGVNVKSVRNVVLLLSGALTAVVTAGCGPIGFIGLVVPHIARLLLRSSNHRVLLPATALFGAAVGELCLLLSVAPGPEGIIPINAITPIIGVPIIIYIIVRRRSIFYFN